MHEHFGVTSDHVCSPGKMSLEECLEAVFGNTGLKWEIRGKYVILTRKAGSITSIHIDDVE